MKAFLKATRSKALRDGKVRGDTPSMSTDVGNIDPMVQSFLEYQRSTLRNTQSANEGYCADAEVAEKIENVKEQSWKSDTRKDVSEQPEVNNFEKKKDGTVLIPNATNGVVSVSLSKFDSTYSDDMNLPEEAVRYNAPARCTFESINSCFSLMKINSGGLENVDNTEKVKIRYSNASIYRRASEGPVLTEAKLKRHQMEVRRFSCK